MYLKELIIVNYRSCKKLIIEFQKDEPNIFIGINDCGKTTILKSLGLLLDDKTSFNSLKENSSKKDFSNSPLSEEEFNNIFNSKNLPLIPYTGNESIVIGNFIIEDNDIDESNQSYYSNLFLWTVEKNNSNCISIARIFYSNSSVVTTYLLTKDKIEKDGEIGFELWNSNATDLSRRIRENNITSEEIENVNTTGRFSNLEKMRAIYSKSNLQDYWASFKFDKGDKATFPIFRYLDWNCSLDDIKKTATDAMATKIESHIKPLKESASEISKKVEDEINKQLEELKDSIGDILPNITALKTKVNINVQESVTDILINKDNSDGDIHIDLQGEGIKRQIWFALIKAGAFASMEMGISNKKFIWAFDEPETHLFPSAQRNLFEIIKEVSKTNVQSLISTHSTVFIDKSKLNTIRNVSLNGESYTCYCECKSVDEIFESLELRNSDFLFYDRFLVIEGDTEAYLIPALYKLYKGKSLENDNIQLINLTGKNKWLESKKALEGVLNGFKKSLEYVVYIFDNDMKADLGDSAITNKMFFVGNQDVEDSISNDVWIAIVSEITENKVNLKIEEIEKLKTEISESKDIKNELKFFKKLDVLVRKKMSDESGEQVTWQILPSKGNDLAQLIIKHLDSIDKISTEIKSAFNKLT
jgi:putative ATP-dependent endonuclease of OLD family